MPEIRFKKLNPEAVIPKYQTAGAAGFDFHLTEDVSFLPQQIVAIGTGLSAAIPAGFVLMLLPRSSAGVKFQLRLANTAGVIDSDYRGEIICVLHNNSANHFKFAKGDRLVQGILLPAPQHTILEVNDLDSTERGAGGFGSTDIPEATLPDAHFFFCQQGLKWAAPTWANLQECLRAGKGLVDVVSTFSRTEPRETIVESLNATKFNLLKVPATGTLTLYVKHENIWRYVLGIRPASVPF